MRTRWIVVAFLVLAAACGDGSPESGSTAAPLATGDRGVVQVTSANGLATLALPADSLPDGISLEDVRLDAVVDETAEPGVPVVAVRLLPSGLVLAEHATLAIVVPDVFKGGLMAIHTSGDSIEFLDGEIEQEDEVFRFITSVRHFSVVTIHDGPFFETSVSVTPETVSEGETQEAVAQVSSAAEPVLVWLMFSSDPGQTARNFTFAAPQPPFQIEDSVMKWWNRDRWDPPLHNVEMTENQSGSGSSKAASTCLEFNQNSVDFTAKLLFDLTLLDRSEAQPFGFLEFGEGLTEGQEEPAEPPEGKAGFTGAQIQLLDLPVGDTIQALVHPWDSAKSICTRPGAAGSSTTTTTTEAPPPGEDPEGDQKDGDTSTQVAAGEGEPGGDIVGVHHAEGEAGEQCFFIDVAGNGEMIAADAPTTGWYDIIISVVDPAGGEWRANVAYFGGTPQDRGVKIGPSVAGQPTLEGATVTVEWVDGDTMKVTVAGGDEALSVETFRASVGVARSDKNFWDSASGVAAS